jgi:hypothetical protein
MLLKPSDQLLLGEPHLLGFRGVSIILVTKFDLGSIHFQNTVSCDGDLVCTCLPEGR